MYKKICEICSKEFVAKHPSKLTCSEKCARELHRIKNRQYKKTRRTVIKNTSSANLNANLIDEDARKARELGLSYGMYKALNR